MIVALQDTREEIPLDLTPLRVEVGTLATGDYSVRGLKRAGRSAAVFFRRLATGDYSVRGLST